MSNTDSVLNASESHSKRVSVVVSADTRHGVASERETAYLLSSNSMRHRLLAAKGQQGGSTLEMVCAKLDLSK